MARFSYSGLLGMVLNPSCKDAQPLRNIDSSHWGGTHFGKEMTVPQWREVLVKATTWTGPELVDAHFYFLRTGGDFGQGYDCYLLQLFIGVLVRLVWS